MLFDAWSHWDKGYGSPFPFHWFHPSKNCNGINGSPNAGMSPQGIVMGWR